MPQSLHRMRRLRLAVATSLVSKIAGALAQIATLPMLLAGLGEDRFAAFVAIVALTQWISPLGLGILPSLTRELAESAAAEDRAKERILVGAGFWLTLGIGLALFTVSMLVVVSVDVQTLIGIPDAVDKAEVSFGLAAAMGLTSVQLFSGLAIAIRTGYQESHIINALSTVANLAVLVATATVLAIGGSIATFVLAIQLPFALLLLADIGRILWVRSYLRPPVMPYYRALAHGDLRALLTTSGAAWVVQMHNFLVNHASLILVSIWFTAEATGAFGASMRAILLMCTVLGLFVFPMVPAMADAWARHEAEWVRRTYRRLLGATLVIAAAAGMTYAVLGPQIMQMWMGDMLAWPRLMCIGFGLFFFAFSTSFMNFHMLLALGATRGVAIPFLAEALLAAALSTWLHPTLGVSGVALALGIATTSVTFWILPLRIYRVLAMPISPLP